MSKETETEGLHCHLAYFGSELACPICNPYCYQNHGMDKINWCGHEKCPMNPKNFKLRCFGLLCCKSKHLHRKSSSDYTSYFFEDCPYRVECQSNYVSRTSKNKDEIEVEDSGEEKLLEDLEEETIREKKTGRHYKGKYIGRGKYKGTRARE
jgi:hypothetical protein